MSLVTNGSGFDYVMQVGLWLEQEKS